MSRLLESSNEPKLNKIAGQFWIEIPTCGHYVQSIRPEKYICFKMTISTMYKVVLKIKRIEYQVYHDGKLFYQGNWKGVMILDEANLRGNVYLIYGPLESYFDTQILRTGWTLVGKAIIGCMFGAFEKTFESGNLEVYSMYSFKNIKEKYNGKEKN